MRLPASINTSHKFLTLSAFKSDHIGVAAIAPVAIIPLATYFAGSFDCSRHEESPMPRLMSSFLSYSLHYCGYPVLSFEPMLTHLISIS